MVGCINTAPKEPTIGFTFYRYDDLFMSTMREAIELHNKDQIALDLNNSKNDQTLQDEQVDGLISKQVAVLAINLVDVEAAESVLKKSQKANIPIIFFNREPDLGVIKSCDSCYYIGTDSSEAGILQGEMIADGWVNHPEWDKNGDGVIQYVMLKGEENHVDTVLRTQYVIETIESHGLTMELLDEDYGNWEDQQAKILVDKWIDSYGKDIELVISNNDAMALGAIISFQNEGYLTKELFVPIYGVDGIKSFMLKIDSGLAMGTVINDAHSQSQAIMDIANMVLDEDISLGDLDWVVEEERIIRIPYVPVTEENVGLYIDE